MNEVRRGNTGNLAVEYGVDGYGDRLTHHGQDTSTVAAHCIRCDDACNRFGILDFVRHSDFTVRIDGAAHGDQHPQLQIGFRFIVAVHADRGVVADEVFNAIDKDTSESRDYALGRRRFRTG